MSTDAYRAIARRHLDSDLAEVRDKLPDAPSDGWIRTIRQALGMSTADLARRMGVSSTAVRRYERSEQAGTIQLATLQRVAEALGARAYHVLVPESSLEGLVAARARAVAERELAAVNHSMDIEQQRPTSANDEAILRRRADELQQSSKLWRDDK